MMKSVEMVILPCDCGTSPIVCPANQVGQVISCPYSGTRMRVVHSDPFALEHWEATERVSELEICAHAFGKQLDLRKRRLALCGVGRIHFSQVRNRWFVEAISAGEQWADSGMPTFGVDDILRKLRRLRPNQYEWNWLAQTCISQVLLFPADHANKPPSSMLAGVFRDFVPNPFIPLEWKPDWLASTVRHVAAHIYAAQDFSAMPILADALQDAGCEDEQILSHCRADRPHARGCWVLDAILGKE